jgi:CRISPR-associated endonuclease/helicase Cas3
MALAHSKNERGETHDLVTHLTQVAKLASGFAAKFGASELAHWVGLWHDIGRFHPAFQVHVKDSFDETRRLCYKRR